MNTTLLIASGVLAASSIGAGLARRHQACKLLLLLDARNSSVSELLDLQQTVADQMGAGAFREQVKLSGEIVCDEPLTAPWSGEPCVAFTNTTTCLMEVREVTTRTDGDGNTQTEVRWQRRDQTIDRFERRCGFSLRQGSQTLPIDPEAAELELECVFSQVDPATRGDTFNTRQLGIERQEAILRPNGMVFVVAECSDAGEHLQLQAPQASGLFVVRRGSEADFTSSIRRWRRIWMTSTWVLIILAAVLLVASVA